MSTEFLKNLKKFDIYTFGAVIVIYLYIHFERKKFVCHYLSDFIAGGRFMSDRKIEIIKLIKYLIYFLGVPLFFLAVIVLAAKDVVGVDAFTTQAFKTGKLPVLAKAYYYPIWIALGLFIIMLGSHIAIAITIKNSRIKMLSMTAVTLVVMLIPLVSIDGAYRSKITKIQESAPKGVNIQNYEKMLGYTRPRTGGYTTYSSQFADKIETFLRTYHISRYVQFYGNATGSFANQPLTYFDFGIDYDKNGKLEPAIGENKRDDELIRVKPTGAKYNRKGKLIENTGYLKFDAEVYNGSEWEKKTFIEKDVTIWQDGDQYRYFRKTYIPQWKQGKYGYALYNANGELGDGYVYSVETALNVLYDYYYAVAELEKSSHTVNYDEMLTLAEERRRADYEAKGMLDVYERETIHNKEKFGLTNEKLDKIVGTLTSSVAQLKALGQLEDLLGGNISELKRLLNEGIKFGELLDHLPTIAGINLKEKIKPIFEKLDLMEVKITIKKELNPSNPSNEYPQLHLVMEDASGKWATNIFLDETMTVKQLGEIVNGLIANVLKITGLDPSLINTVVGLIKGKLPIEFHTLDEMKVGKFINIEKTIKKLLGGIYSYRSPVLKPLYEYYVDKNGSDFEKAEQKLYAQRDSALEEGGLRGALVGSTLIPNASFLAGDKLGAGAMVAKQSQFNNLDAINQLKIENELFPKMYPILIAREMLMVFLLIAVFATFLACYISAMEGKIIENIGKIQEKKAKAKKEKLEEKEIAEKEQNEVKDENEIKINESTKDKSEGGEEK